MRNKSYAVALQRDFIYNVIYAYYAEKYHAYGWNMFPMLLLIGRVGVAAPGCFNDRN